MIQPIIIPPVIVGHTYNGHVLSNGDIGIVMICASAFLLWFMISIWISERLGRKYGLDILYTFITLALLVPLLIGGLILLK